MVVRPRRGALRSRSRATRPRGSAIDAVAASWTVLRRGRRLRYDRSACRESYLDLSVCGCGPACDGSWPAGCLSLSLLSPVPGRMSSTLRSGRLWIRGAGGAWHLDAAVLAIATGPARSLRIRGLAHGRDGPSPSRLLAELRWERMPVWCSPSPYVGVAAWFAARRRGCLFRSGSSCGLIPSSFNWPGRRIDRRPPPAHVRAELPEVDAGQSFGQVGRLGQQGFGLVQRLDRGPGRG